jgi:hypothetical protein
MELRTLTPGHSQKDGAEYDYLIVTAAEHRAGGWRSQLRSRLATDRPWGTLCPTYANSCLTGLLPIRRRR